MIELLYFAWVRERIGTGGERLELPEGIADVESLLNWLAGRGAGYAAAFEDRSRVRVAVDQVFATPTTSVSPGAEVAIFPPVTGG